MRALIQHHQILALWIAVFLINGSGIAALFYWALRNGQFSDNEHGRYLALEAYPEVKPDGDSRNRTDRR